MYFSENNCILLFFFHKKFNEKVTIISRFHKSPSLAS